MQLSARVKIINRLLILLILGLLVLLLWSRFDGGRPHDPKNYIINNLRQIEGAKQQWALENNVTGNVQVTEQNVGPYLGRGTNIGWVVPFAEERYVLKLLEESPEAHLTKKIKEMPKGTVIRFGTNGYDEVILPK